ncbi:multiple epidermal growth factor-like domains protein 8 [Pezoporus occidentalis]|uniref:multiple epidermal growth factor-like domains protein 8 n=1 Tax=Pezoporus occidentalis TaxID=407982 RepID=UPI002F9177F6
MGGELAGGALTNDVWSLEPEGRGWRELRPLPGHAPAPPGLAAHAVAVVDDWLYVFGGRTTQDLFSSLLFRFPLLGGRWELVEPWGGKAPAAAGHSLLFHPPTRTLILYGGHRPASARFSSRVNQTHLFHVDRRHWAPLRGGGAAGPRGRAFHSATLLGDYMVLYGGHVHAHYEEEKCYEEGVFFYHVGCHQWVTPEELRGGDPEEPGSRPPPPPPRGRFGHVAAALGGGVLLVAGGFSGDALGDVIAYKLPRFAWAGEGPGVSHPQ